MHGIHSQHDGGENFDRTITERMGGEIETTIKTTGVDYLTVTRDNFEEKLKTLLERK